MSNNKNASADNTSEVKPEEEMTFVSHLVEMRDRLLRVVLAVVIIFLSLFYFANDLYTLLAGPLTRHLPEGSTMIAIDVASPFLTPFKLTLVLSIFLCMPYILHQIWRFVAPGLYQNERRMAMPLLFASTVLFYLGMVFAYFVVFPLVFKFFTGVTPENVAVMTDISKYLDFVLTLLFAFGVSFEIPIITVVLVWMGVTTPEKLRAKRSYVIVGAFVVGMLLTPPDVISQTLLAIPMWLLFELGIIFSRFYVPKRDEEDDFYYEDEQEENNIGGAVANPEPASPTTTSSAAATVVEPELAADYERMSEEDMDDELDRIDDEMDALDDEMEKENKTDTDGDNSTKNNKGNEDENK
ncbi:MAG TPA: twin-arginine translocase subunit TatC [Gammaproteobacteria bacterium]|nr:twin-arginine translocase subunit TatC [Gammaproteobacteria bacterium]